jgi:hypothetical protein
MSGVSTLIEKVVFVDFTHELQKVVRTLPADSEPSRLLIPHDKIVEFCFPEPDSEVLSQTELRRLVSFRYVLFFVHE